MMSRMTLGMRPEGWPGTILSGFLFHPLPTSGLVRVRPSPTTNDGATHEDRDGPADGFCMHDDAILLENDARQVLCSQLCAAILR